MLPQLGLGLLALGDISESRHGQEDVSLVIHNRPRPSLQLNALTGHVHLQIIHRGMFAAQRPNYRQAVNGVSLSSTGHPERIGLGRLGDRAAKDSVWRFALSWNSENVASVLIKQLGAPVRAVHDHPNGHRLDRLCQPVLAGAQIAVGALRVGLQDIQAVCQGHGPQGHEPKQPTRQKSSLNGELSISPSRTMSTATRPRKSTIQDNRKRRAGR